MHKVCNRTCAYKIKSGNDDDSSKLLSVFSPVNDSAMASTTSEKIILLQTHQPPAALPSNVNMPGNKLNKYFAFRIGFFDSIIRPVFLSGR